MRRISEIAELGGCGWRPRSLVSAWPAGSLWCVEATSARRYATLAQVLVPDRRRLLLEYVRRTGSAQVDDLAAAVSVSPSTVRRDLALLESQGLLRRAHGGAYLEASASMLPAPPPSGDPDAKRRIGAAAAEQVVDGMTVMILAGSTTQTMLTHLADRSLTVVTNGLEIGHQLAGYPGISLVMLGGVLQREQMTLLGPLSQQNMSDLHVDVMFAGAYGLDPLVGVTGTKVIQAGYHRTMLKHTESLVVLADSTKLGRQGPTLLAAIDQVDMLFTDRDADEQLIELMRQQGPTVIVC